MKHYTQEQKIIGEQLNQLQETSGRKYLVEEIDKRIKELENHLTGRILLINKEKPSEYENLDEKKYTRASLLREELNSLERIKNYPKEWAKKTGMISIDNK